MPISGGGDEHRRSSDAASLAEQIAKLLAEKSELTDTLVRRQADFENYRKRVERERQTEHHRGIEGLIESLLPVLDGFERALAAHGDAGIRELPQGLRADLPATRKYFIEEGPRANRCGGETVRSESAPCGGAHGDERITPMAPWSGFCRPGYMFHGKVLRPAMVRVTANAAQQTSQPN